jgi:hypothetical protein
MTQMPDQAAEVFISYSSRDHDRVVALADVLRRAGVSCWLDRNKIAGAVNYGPEIVRGIRECKVLLLMCSNASLHSRNVKQEIQLAWKYQRPYLPLLLEPVSYPEQVSYWLEGWQWVEVMDHPQEHWLPPVLEALALAGVESAGGKSAGPLPVRVDQGLEGLRALARFTDQLWPIAAERSPGGGVRGLGAPQDAVQHGHRLGSRIRLVLETQTDGYLLLLDEGPEQIVYCLCPSRFAPETRVRAGRMILPQPGAAHDSFVITGQPGREHLLAILSDEPLGLDWMPRDPRTPARVLNGADLAALLALLRNLEGNRWTALATYFDVLGNPAI